MKKGSLFVSDVNKCLAIETKLSKMLKQMIDNISYRMKRIQIELKFHIFIAPYDIGLTLRYMDMMMNTNSSRADVKQKSLLLCNLAQMKYVCCRFWSLLWHEFPPRSLSSLPLYTSFCRGWGKTYSVNGKVSCRSFSDYICTPWSIKNVPLLFFR